MTDTDKAPAGAPPTAAMLAEERKAKEQAETDGMRLTCLAGLRARGVTGTLAEYNGFADQGHVDHVRYTPGTAAVPEALRENVLELMWRLAWRTNPGFENDDGGRGEIEWDLAADHIIVRHWACFIDEIFSEHEGL